MYGIPTSIDVDADAGPKAVIEKSARWDSASSGNDCASPDAGNHLQPIGQPSGGTC